jgi:poly-gamma-glutamate synthesis protein (capsule biosynthesis protein)
MAADTVRLMAVGDVMLGDSSHFLGRGVGNHIRRFGPQYPLEKVKGILGGADVLVGNLESPLSSVPGRNSWERVYRGPSEAASGLGLAPHTIMTLANNHILEHGNELLEETRALLDGAGIGHAGLSSDGSRDRSVKRWTAKDLSFTLFCDSLIRDISGRKIDAAATEGWLLDSLRNDSSDVRIVSLHWGDEYVTTPSPEQRRLARLLVEAGATLVLGHHPHVLQPVEEIGSSLVAYSLGNFLFDQDWTNDTRTGGILDLDIGRNGVGRWDFLATQTDHQCQPFPASPECSDRALAIIRDPQRYEEEAYRGLLKTASNNHRLQMKWELVRNLHRVKPDTLHFLLTKVRRPKSRS